MNKPDEENRVNTNRLAQTTHFIDKADIDRAEKNLRELHEYNRHSITSLLAFYSFFITANLVGLSKYATEPSAGRAWIVLLCLLVHSISAVIGFCWARNYLKSLSKRLEDWTKHMNANRFPDGFKPAGPDEAKLFSSVTVLMIGTLAITGLCWLVLLIYSVNPG